MKGKQHSPVLPFVKEKTLHHADLQIKDEDVGT
jgi:hypothetical protein